jgi:hypothetical protein
LKNFAPVVALEPEFLLDDAREQPRVGKVGLGGGFQVFVPAGEQARRRSYFNCSGRVSLIITGEVGGVGEGALLIGGALFQIGIDDGFG